jgi:hypothetical protein
MVKQRSEMGTWGGRKYLRLGAAHIEDKVAPDARGRRSVGDYSGAARRSGGDDEWSWYSGTRARALVRFGRWALGHF